MYPSSVGRPWRWSGFEELRRLAFRLRCIAAAKKMIHHPLAPGKLRVMRRTVEQVPEGRNLVSEPYRRPRAVGPSFIWRLDAIPKVHRIALEPLRASTVLFSSDATELWSCHIAGASRLRLHALFPSCCQLARFACSCSCLSAPACWTVPRPRPSPPSAVAATAWRRLIDLECRARPSLSRWPHAERQRAQLRRALSVHIGTRCSWQRGCGCANVGGVLEMWRPAAGSTCYTG